MKIRHLNRDKNRSTYIKYGNVLLSLLWLSIKASFNFGFNDKLRLALFFPQDFETFSYMV